MYCIAISSVIYVFRIDFSLQIDAGPYTVYVFDDNKESRIFVGYQIFYLNLLKVVMAVEKGLINEFIKVLNQCS